MGDGSGSDRRVSNALDTTGTIGGGASSGLSVAQELGYANGPVGNTAGAGLGLLGIVTGMNSMYQAGQSTARQGANAQDAADFTTGGLSVFSGGVGVGTGTGLIGTGTAVAGAGIVAGAGAAGYGFGKGVVAASESDYGRVFGPSSSRKASRSAHDDRVVAGPERTGLDYAADRGVAVEKGMKDAGLPDWLAKTGGAFTAITEGVPAAFGGAIAAGWNWLTEDEVTIGSTLDDSLATVNKLVPPDPDAGKDKDKDEWEPLRQFGRDFVDMFKTDDKDDTIGGAISAGLAAGGGAVTNADKAKPDPKKDKPSSGVGNLASNVASLITSW